MFSAFVVCSRVFLTINAETRKLTPPQFALRSSVGPNPFFGVCSIHTPRSLTGGREGWERVGVVGMALPCEASEQAKNPTGAESMHKKLERQP